MMKTLVYALVLLVVATSCVPPIVKKTADTSMPEHFVGSSDTVSTGVMSWRTYYHDSQLVALIDTALQHNKELGSVMQEIMIAQNEVETRKGDYLPFVNVRAGAGLEKVAQYTRSGAVEEQLEVAPGRSFPTPLSDFSVSADVSWEVDIWKKLRNSTKASAMRYLSTIEGTNFMVTNIVAEVAASYYELMALDNLKSAIDTNIRILRNALDIVRQQKEAAKATELAVRKFEAEVLKNESRKYEVSQRITETENKINLLLGRYPQPVQRNSDQFLKLTFDSLHAGLPSQLLSNRPDVRRAELELQASDLDIDVARARFYPTFNIAAGVGLQAFNTKYLVTTPESMLYGIAGELMVPLINRNAITSAYYTANSRQIQAAYEYEQTILNAHIEVVNDLAKIENMQRSLELKTQQVEALTASVDISQSLFTSARADYMEVLMTQRDALEAKMELIETKAEQLHTYVNVYQALGGGWR